MYIQRDDVRLWYDIQGRGEATLLFVHGWLTNGDVWHHQIEEFSRSHQVMTIDLRGFGRSGRPDVEYTFDLFADDIDYILKQLDIEKPVFIGWSKGVSIGLVYAAAHLDNLSKMVLVGGGPKFLTSDDFEPGLDPQEFEQTVQQMREDFDAGVWSFIHAEIPEPDQDELKRWIFSLSRQTTPEVALNSIINDTRYDLRPILKRITTPTLVCYGDLDVICPPGASQAIVDGLPNAKLHAFPGLGHIPFLTDPEVFNAQLHSFLNG